MRTCDLLEAFRARGWAAAFASSSAPNEHTAALQGAGVATYSCPPNREAALAEVLAAARPTVVVLDRFYAEEAFSFRVRELAPRALRVLDMQAGDGPGWVCCVHVPGTVACGKWACWRCLPEAALLLGCC